MALTICWSVRPSYHVGGTIRYGEWMRFVPPPDPEAKQSVVAGPVSSLVGRQASLAPAYIQDFASLEIKCGSK